MGFEAVTLLILCDLTILPPLLCVCACRVCYVCVTVIFSHAPIPGTVPCMSLCKAHRRRQTYLPPDTLTARLARSVRGFEALNHDQRRGQRAVASLQRGVGFFQPQSMNSMLMAQGRSDRRQPVPWPPYIDKHVSILSTSTIDTM